MHSAEMDKKEEEAAREVIAATFKQLSAQLDHDMSILEQKVLKSKAQEAAAAVQDAKFLRDRQQSLSFA